MVGSRQHFTHSGSLRTKPESFCFLNPLLFKLRDICGLSARPDNQPDLRGEAGSSKHLQWHSHWCSNSFALKVLQQEPPASPRTSSQGTSAPGTDQQLCKASKTEPRHRENQSFGGCFPPTAEIFALTALKPLRENSTFLFSFPSTIFHFSTQQLNQPKPV